VARYGQDTIEEVRTRAEIVEVIGAHVRLRRSGRNFTGLCPFHDEKTPSFSVSPERGFFHCFGCGAGGTVFDFVMKHEGLTFPEALQALAGRYGVTLPQPEAGAGGPAAGERDALYGANQLATEFYAHVLWNTSEGAVARDYLSTRGIAVETARTFILGFAPARPANLAAALHKRDLAEKRGLGEAALKLGLLKKDDRGASYDMFRARLMFPIRDPQGRVIAFGGRVLDDRLPKYINSPESPLYSKARTLYGLTEARPAIAKGDRVIIVEGYIDTIALWQAGFKETVASLGTSLTVEQLRVLARYTRNLIACFDGDAAGRKASTRALEVFLDAGLLGRGAFIPVGFDPDTLVRQRGTQAFNEVLEAAELLVDYFLREQVAHARGSTEGRARAAERVAGILGKITNPFEFDLLAGKAAAMLGVGEELLRREARQGARGAAGRGIYLRTPPIAATAKQAVHSAAIQAELGLLMLALRFSQLRGTIRERMSTAGDSDLYPLIVEICESTERAAALDTIATSRIGDDQRDRFSAMMVETPELDEARAQALMLDYLDALDQNQRRGQVAELRRVAAAGKGDEAAAAAQAVITLRRQSKRG
jgi:DNA primase